MKNKMGKSGLKPAMPPKGKEKGGADARGLTRKDGFSKESALRRHQGDSLKPRFGDVGDDDLEEQLEDVEEKLAENPKDRELHIKKYRLLRKLGERGKMRACLNLQPGR